MRSVTILLSVSQRKFVLSLYILYIMGTNLYVPMLCMYVAIIMCSACVIQIAFRLCPIVKFNHSMSSQRLKNSCNMFAIFKLVP